ncbi:MAG TPA: CheR family methyltransferase [Candidatus Dormibacteraeota bacterium]|nr:CheR family methyltransferase [Candidatus Dormibacteraeota bacterium]
MAPLRAPVTAAVAPTLEDVEVGLLLEGVRQQYGIDLGRFGSPPLRRRLRRCLAAEGVETFSALQDRVLHDPGCLHRFVRAVAVQVTGMFRDPRMFEAVRRQVVPWLRTHPSIRVWQAGCSSGEEAYSMAILLDEEGLLERARIYASDVDTEVLGRAREGRVPVRRLAAYAEAHRRAGGSSPLLDHLRVEGDWAVLDARLRSRITWLEHNLGTDGSFNDFHLLLCSNVLMYLDRAPRSHALEVLGGSVVMFGFLGLGSRELLGPGVESAGFRHVAGGEVNLYKRVP